MYANVTHICNIHNQFAASFHSAHPYPHVEIPNFFSHAFASELATQFPSPHACKSGWFLYNNPIEIKFANNDRTSLPPCFNAAIDLLNSDLTRRFVSAISGVPFLEEVIFNFTVRVPPPSICDAGPPSPWRRHPLPPSWRQT